MQRECAFEEEGRKKNGEKTAAERETNSLRSLKDTGKNCGKSLSPSSSPTPSSWWLQSLAFCLPSPLPPSEISLALSSGACCLYLPHLNRILRAYKTALNCLTFQNRYIIFSQKAIKAMQAQFPTVSKTGAVFQLDSSICKTSECCLPQEYSLHCTLGKCAQTRSHFMFFP